MRISIPVNQCESNGMNPLPVAAIKSATAAMRCGRNSATGRRMALFTLLLVMTAGPFAGRAEETNSPARSNRPATNTTPARTESAPQKLDEAAFRIIAERNIFNSERIGAVRIASSRRPARVESFKLVGTMAYAKGAFAFFEGSSSELTKVIQADGVIAGHKLVDILTDGVKLEADGKILEVPVGSAMRREDEGAWRPGEAVSSSASSNYAVSRESSRDNGDSNRSSRNDRNDRDNDSSRSRRNGSDSERGNGAESNRSASASPVSAADQSEILKRLMERRAKESE